jgi:GntR family transcriptional repressor for pyruvate dehydrogenase complex
MGETARPEPVIGNGWERLPGGDQGRRGLLSERVAWQIERLIVDQQKQPGDRLPSGNELAAGFGVSRTVIRDALAMLEQRGLVQSRPGSGVYVHDGSSAALADVLGQMLRQNAISVPELMGARQLLEVHNARTAAGLASEADLDTMARSIDEMRRAHGPMGFVDADVAFHEALAGAAGNRVLAAFLRSLRPVLFKGMLVGTSLDGAREAAVREHGALLEAVAARDPELAERLMSEHLSRSYHELVQAGLAAIGGELAGVNS